MKNCPIVCIHNHHSIVVESSFDNTLIAYSNIMTKSGERWWWTYPLISHRLIVWEIDQETRSFLSRIIKDRNFHRRNLTDLMKIGRRGKISSGHISRKWIDWYHEKVGNLLTKIKSVFIHSCHSFYILRRKQDFIVTLLFEFSKNILQCLTLRSAFIITFLDTFV